MSILNPTCCVCKQKAGITATGNKNFKMLCKTCRKKILSGTGYINCSTFSTEECIERVKKYNINEERLKTFKVTKSIGESSVFKYISIDEDNKKIGLYPKLASSKILPTIVSFDDIINFELIEDGNSIISGGLGKAIVGDILFGGVGAIVGGITASKKGKNICNSLYIRISLNNIDNPNFIINFINRDILKTSSYYKTTKEKALECISLLEYICNTQKNKNQNKNITSSLAEEIKKYKELLDSGAITQEEYIKIKTDLINNNK